MVAHARARQIFLAIGFLLGLGWLTFQMETAEEPFHAYPAPPFSITSTAGESLSYPGKKGPILIIFTRPDDTLEQLELDVKALNFAKENQAQCWLISKGASAERFKPLDFVNKGYDPEGTVAANFPGHDGLVEWVVVDMTGTVRWSGRRSAMDLKAKLTSGL